MGETIVEVQSPAIDRTLLHLREAQRAVGAGWWVTVTRKRRRRFFARSWLRRLHQLLPGGADWQARGPGYDPTCPHTMAAWLRGLRDQHRWGSVRRRRSLHQRMAVSPSATACQRKIAQSLKHMLILKDAVPASYARRRWLTGQTMSEFYQGFCCGALFLAFASFTILGVLYILSSQSDPSRRR